MTTLAPAARALARSPEYFTPPSAMMEHAVLGGHAGGVIDGGDLGHADAGHHAGGADGARADADLHAVGPPQ